MSILFARVYDRLAKATEEACFQAWRADLLADVSGDVLEIGAGTGNNLSHYRAGVTRLVLSEPDATMRRKLERRLPEVRSAGGLTGALVEITDAAVDDLSFPGESFDAVVSTLVLCSVPDQAAALDALRRVLRPGGHLVYLEHVAADGRPKRLRWQHRLEPVWKRLLGGCHLTRHTAEAIADAGFDLGAVSRESARKATPVVRPTVRGIAVRPPASRPVGVGSQLSS